MIRHRHHLLPFRHRLPHRFRHRRRRSRSKNDQYRSRPPYQTPSTRGL